MSNSNYHYPRSIICLTEESVETLWLIGKLDLVKGVSSFVKRPKEALTIPKVSQFTQSNIKKILELNVDLIVGFSDIQKDIARELIANGQNVWITNHRSLNQILSYILMLSSMVGGAQEGLKLCQELESKIDKILQKANSLPFRPKVYFEEWDEPMISAIKWVSECIQIAGGIDIFAEKSNGSLASQRIVQPSDVISANPDIIFACWCGKKFRKNSMLKRPGFENINAVKNDAIYELEPEIFLQPGPAPILEGLDLLYEYFDRFTKGQS